MEAGSTTFTLNINLVVVGIFLLITLIIGLWAGRNVKTLKDYALANREFGVGVLSMTFLATYISGNHLLILPADFSHYGIVALLDNVGPTIALVFLGMFVAPALVYFRNAITAGDIAAELYGTSARIILGIAGTLCCISIGAVSILVIGKVGHMLLGIRQEYAILLGGGILVLYATRGGIHSVAMTDIIQFIALIIVVGVVSNVLILKLDGVQAIFATVHEKYPQHFQIIGHPDLKENLFIGISNALGVYLIAPPFMQRMLMPGSANKARKMLFVAASFYTLLFVLFMIIGFAGLLLYPDVTGSEIVPNLIINCFPKAAHGFLAVGILAMSMSTADSFLNAGGLVFVHDILKPVFDKKKIPFEELKYVRLATFFIGSITILLAGFANLQAMSVYRINWYAVTTLSAVFILLISGILGLKVNKSSFYLSFFSSLLILIPARILGKATMDVRLLSTLMNGIVFFTSHCIINKGFVCVNRATGVKKKWKPSWEKLFNWLGAYFPTPINIARYSEYKVIKHGENALMFSIFLCISYMLPYMLANKENIGVYNYIMLIRSIGVGLCAGLMLKTLWSKRNQKRYFPLYWHVTLLYCLPFSTTLIFLLGGGSMNWPAEIGLAILLLIVLVDWLSFLILGGLGVGAALLVFYGLYGVLPEIPDFETAYYLTITCISTTLVGLVFARRKEIYAAIRFRTVATLARFIGHEVNWLSNYTLSPSQQIYRELEWKAEEMTREIVREEKENDKKNKNSKEKIKIKEKEEGYFIKKETYDLVVKNAKTIEKGTKFMVETAKQLASIIRQYADSLNNPEICSMRALVKETIKTYPGEEDQRKRIKMKVEENFIVKVPVRALVFVLHNIIRNAFVHGGREDVEVGLIIEKGQQIHIKDNGKGIPAGNLEKIFEMFFTTGHPQVSTGIGLGFAKMVVEWINGKMWCESSTEEGNTYTNFIIEFPLEGEEMEEEERRRLKEKDERIEMAEKLMREKVHLGTIQKVTGLKREELEDLAGIMCLEKA